MTQCNRVAPLNGAKDMSEQNYIKGHKFIEDHNKLKRYPNFI